MTELHDLQALFDWMQAQTPRVTHARVGNLELRIESRGAAPPIAAMLTPPRLPTKEELDAKRKEDTRRRAAVELGFTPTDEQMQMLGFIP